MEYSKNVKQEMSKFLSYVLRHAPEKINLNLSKDGWTSVEDLINKTNENQKGLKGSLTLDLLKVVVAEDNKGRYSFSDDFTKIRANQGHSIKVDLGLKNQVPPTVLYHGTVSTVLDLIQKGGLKPMSRHAVHLSKDVETAKVVADRRKGENVILEVDSKSMYADGFKFQCSENGVWLTDEVPPKYISCPNFKKDIKGFKP